jgi:PAS domain S-box-containing protein
VGHEEQEQGRLQAAIEKSAREWQLTFDSVDTGILMLGADGVIVRLNRAVKELLAKSYRDVLGRPVEALGPGPLWTKAAELSRQVRATRCSASGQSRDEATGKTWDITGNPIIEVGAEGCRTILLIRDITEVVELQASLYRSETMAAIGALVAGVCHEVRNPLFGISATLDAFEERFGTREEYREYLQVLRTELTRMNDLMRDLLEYGRPPSQAFTAESVENVIAQAVHSCRLIAKECRVRIINDVKRGLPPVLMERRRLLQVFQNLIENALQHSGPGQAITIRASLITDGGRQWIWCAVLDSGPGFQEADLPRIFQPFYTKRRGGTGLGLSIVQRIVEEHGGRIRASNRIEGGASVAVRLPCADPGSLRTEAGERR